MRESIMKKVILLLITISIPSILGEILWPTGGPEIYIRITDNESVEYKIYAEKGDNSPIYGKNLEYTNEFDTAEDYFTTQPEIETQNEGFDWAVDPNSLSDTSNDDLGYGFYKIFIVRNHNSPYPENVVWFYLDFRMDHDQVINSPDIIVKIIRNTNGSFSIQNSYQVSSYTEYFWRELSDGDSLLVWENNYGQEKDWTLFTQDIPVTNEVDGVADSSLKIELIEKSEGFPVAESTYPVGYNFSADEQVPFWKEGTYKFEAVTEEIEGNRIRDWNNGRYIGAEANVTLRSEDSDIKANYYPTHPLTVHNYLEGGSGGSYDLTWTTPNPEREQGTFQSLEIFNVFDSLDNDDKYRITIDQTIPGQYGTNWEFQYWDNGSTSLTRSNIAVSEPTTLKAYYKGVDKTDAANALTNNNQAKIIRTGTSSTGTLFKVYESMDCVWLEKSTNNGVSWELMNDGKPHQHFL